MKKYAVIIILVVISTSSFFFGLNEKKERISQQRKLENLLLQIDSLKAIVRAQNEIAIKSFSNAEETLKKTLSTSDETKK